LELLLGRAGAPNSDELTQALLHRFGSFAATLAAPSAALASLVSADVALELGLLHAVAVRIALAQVHAREVLSSSSAVSAYLKVLLAAQPREQVWAMFLDKKNQLILSEKIAEGTVDHAPVYPREIVRRALELGSSALILAHNHPSGDPNPSRVDIEMTSQVVAAARALGIVVHDHMIVGRDQVASLKGLGLM
jgi:DNA repair protein RadC